MVHEGTEIVLFLIATNLITFTIGYLVRHFSLRRELEEAITPPHALKEEIPEKEAELELELEEKLIEKSSPEFAPTVGQQTFSQPPSSDEALHLLVLEQLMKIQQKLDQRSEPTHSAIFQDEPLPKPTELENKSPPPSIPQTPPQKLRSAPLPPPAPLKFAPTPTAMPQPQRTPPQPPTPPQRPIAMAQPPLRPQALRPIPMPPPYPGARVADSAGSSEMAAFASPLPSLSPSPAPVPAYPPQFYKKKDFMQPPDGDNLMLIKGIGPFIDRVLRDEFQIKTFQQLAELTPEMIHVIETRVYFNGLFKKYRWIERATELHRKFYH